jgi:hypothetical protein
LKIESERCADLLTRKAGGYVHPSIGKHQFTRCRMVAHLEQVLNFRVTDLASSPHERGDMRDSKMKTRISRSLSSGAHSRDRLAQPG